MQLSISSNVFLKIRIFLAVSIAAALFTAFLPPTKSIYAAESNCAWGWMSDGSGTQTGLTDRNASYASYDYHLIAGEKLIIRGTFPAARYFSFTTSSRSGDLYEHVVDRDVPADAGRPNPFVTSTIEPGTYTVEVSTLVRPGANQQGTIAAGNTWGGSDGKLLYRIYLPTNPSQAMGDVPLPSLAIRSLRGVERPIPQCATAMSPTDTSYGLAFDAPDLSRPRFRRWETDGRMANLDVTYVATSFHSEPGRIVVLHAKAPTYANTRAGVPVTNASDVRYWSYCTYERRLPFPVTDCAADYEVPLDAQSNYTVVISSPADRPANATAENGIAWLAWNSEYDGAVILREMLPASTFTHSALLTPVGYVLTRMGDYAPKASYCTRTAFEANNCAMP